MSSETWVAFGPSWIFQWSPAEPYLEGSETVLELVRDELARDDELLPTPTSDPVPSTAASSVAVYTALCRVMPDILSVSSGAPTPPPVPPGAVA